MAGPPDAPPQVGVPITRESINAKLGGASQSLKKSTIQLDDLEQWAAAYSAEQLVDAYGFTLEEANLFKSAMTEVPQIVAMVDGLQWLSRTWGA